MPKKHDITIAGQSYLSTDTLRMKGANSEEGKTIDYIAAEWDTLSFNDSTSILGTHKPGTGKDGFSQVSITSNNLVASNIKQGVTIFGVTGTHSSTPTGTNITTSTFTIENSGSGMTLTVLLPLCVNGYVTTSQRTVAEYSTQTFTDVMEDMPIMIYVTNTSGYWQLYETTGMYCYIAEELGSDYERVGVFGCVLESDSSTHRFWIGHDCCFDGASKVLLPNGATKALVDVNIGDTVMSYNETTGAIEENKVTALGTVELRRATQITLEDDTVIRMNIYHPLYTQDGWRSITGYNGLPELTIEDKLLNSEGEYIGIKGIENVVIDEATYYTLKVEGNNNFYVNGILAQGKDKG